MSKIKKNEILTITLNPSIDKAYYLDHDLVPGQVNRAAKIINTAGGKGLNVARVIKLCSQMDDIFERSLNPVCSGFIGGYNGQYLLSLLDTDKIDHDFLHIDGETRSSINVLRGDSSTEFLEPGPTISDKDIEKFISKFCEMLKSGEFCSVVMSGSLPPGIPNNFYSKLIAIAKKLNVTTFLDTSGEALNTSLLDADIGQKPFFIKPNKDEAQVLLGAEINSIDDAKSAALKLCDLGVEVVAITLGGQGAVVACNGVAIYSKAKAPQLSVVNTVGCGDTFVGVFAVSNACQKDLKSSMNIALAASKSNAASELTGHVEHDEIKAMLSAV